jgi:Serine/threonine protein kinase
MALWYAALFTFAPFAASRDTGSHAKTLTRSREDAKKKTCENNCGQSDMANDDRYDATFAARLRVRPSAAADDATMHLRPVATTKPALPREATIGRYRLIELLGEGGMGSVYLAEQREPMQRIVALKLMRSSLAGPNDVARFGVERQTLARLSHPNVAAMYDAGATDDGFPFFVMERVEGTTFVAYCDQHRLPIRQRIELLIQICKGVQHAHQKGIIHRDLKPSNVLVTAVEGQAVPKIIDFGIAKALPGAMDQPAGAISQLFQKFLPRLCIERLLPR